jgi:hypothetical protein
MAHEDAGKYAAKHPSDTTLNLQIAEAIRQRSSDGKLACATGEKISKELNVSIAEVGVATDLLEMKIKECQLGLFGWGEKPSHGKDIQAADSVSPEIKKALEKAAVSGIVTCATLWTIADRLGVKRTVVSTACETLNVKIRSCQLGTF